MFPMAVLPGGRSTMLNVLLISNAVISLCIDFLHISYFIASLKLLGLTPAVTAAKDA